MKPAGKCTWDYILRRIRECRREFAEPLERIRCFERIIEDCGEDGMVFFAMGEEYEAKGDYESALRCYEKAHSLFPLPKWRDRAKRAIRRVEEKITGRKRWRSLGDLSNVLFIVGCTKRKIWDDIPTAPRKVPARFAYRGWRFVQFLKFIELLEKSLEAKWLILSAKYGLIEPWHPIENYDVTLGQEGAITDEELRNQVLHGEFWGSKGSLRNFHTVCFFGPDSYCEMVRRAFEEIVGRIIQLTLSDMLNLVDPYLLRVINNLRRSREVMVEAPSEAVCHAFNAVMNVFQRRIIDEKGVKVLEDLKRRRKMYLDILLKVLKDAGVEIGKDLENQLHMLRELRNKVQHEDYKPTEDETAWALRLAKNVASSWYPIVLNWLDP